MTRAITFTKAQVRRAVKAAESAGLAVVAFKIHPDGRLAIRRRQMTTAEKDLAKPLAKLKEAREIAKCASPAQFRAMVEDGIFPQPVKNGYWDKAALRKAVELASIKNDSTQFSEVYFLEVQNYIKIGFSTGTHIRIASMQTASPFEIKLIASVKGCERNEQEIHERVKHLRHRGEWFRKTKGLMAYIQWLKANQETP
jgi:hypothetical protein